MGKLLIILKNISYYKAEIISIAVNICRKFIAVYEKL